MLQDSLKTELKRIGERRYTLLKQLSEEISYLNQHNIKHTLTLPAVDDQEYTPIDYEELKSKLADLGFLERIKSEIALIPESNGSQYFNKMTSKIGLIADEFLFNSFKDVGEFVYISKDATWDHYKDLKVVIIASTWKGIKNDWRGMANPNSNVRKHLIKLINDFKQNDIKVVFYSKEDPTNYEKFVGIAQHCDYIFTTAVEMIQRYKEECNNENVHVLEFGVNPIYNNPIGIAETKKYNEVIFAGSWYEKYPHRINDSRRLFDGVLMSNKNLKIIDRNFHLKLPDHYYPRRYLPNISPSLDHTILQKTFKLYDWVINLNSVKNSETMFANRVYELQAMGNLILSNYSVGINNMFPNIFMAYDESEVPYILHAMKDLEVYEHKMLGVRKVMNQHTTFHRLQHLLNVVGSDEKLVQDKKVAVVVKEFTDRAQENFYRQTYPYKELLTENELENKYDLFDYVAFFDDKYFYEEYYLEDMINGFKYTNSQYITKDSFLKDGKITEGIQHDYVSEYKEKYRTVFSTEYFTLSNLLNMGIQANLENGYSIDALEIQEGKLLQYNETDKASLKLSVIVPVYNNGEHLLSKCFLSLRRSSIFNNMEIILVDDGSTDNATKKILTRLERKYVNVKTYFFEDGGSGSASRPRNKGNELATTNFITYLDPDNEAINDGYAKLLSELELDKSVDMVVGNIIKVDKQVKNLNYSFNIFKWNPEGIVDDTYQFIIDSHMKAQSIQALIVKKEIIKNNNLKMVEGATGQDTLFFQELLLHSKKVKALNEMIHIYYAAVSNSVTNTISEKFFSKYLILEKERLSFLKSNNLLNIYMRDRFNFYFIRWYLARVPRIDSDQIAPALSTLYKIYKLYEPYIKDRDPVLTKFDKFMKKEDYTGLMNYVQELAEISS